MAKLVKPTIGPTSPTSPSPREQSLEPPTFCTAQRTSHADHTASQDYGSSGSSGSSSCLAGDDERDSRSDDSEGSFAAGGESRAWLDDVNSAGDSSSGVRAGIARLFSSRAEMEARLLFRATDSPPACASQAAGVCGGSERRNDRVWELGPSSAAPVDLLGPATESACGGAL